jgi:integrase/recombinase XerD
MDDRLEVFGDARPAPFGALSLERFDNTTLTPFYERSVSEETRRAYKRVVREFLLYLNHRRPSEITPGDVQRWRDHLIRAKKRPATVTFKLSVIRSMFDYLRAGGYILLNPALTKLVPPPALPEDSKGRALSPDEVYHLLAGPDVRTTAGARDYSLMLLMLRTSLRVSEACGLMSSLIRWSHGRWTVRVKVKGGRERVLPLPEDVKKALDTYLRLDNRRREILGCGGEKAYIFQPITNYRTLSFSKPLSTTMAWNIVKKWGDYSGVGKLSPHDLRRTAITRALDQGLSYRQVQMMSGHKDPKTVMRYDHNRENLDQNAVNFLNYAREVKAGIVGSGDYK